VPPVRVYDLALLDLDGVVYVGPDSVPGAPEALAAVTRAGLKVAYVTNNASRPPETVAEHLTGLGVPATGTTSSPPPRRPPGSWRAGCPGAPGARRRRRGPQPGLREAGLTPVATMDDHPEAVTQGFGPDVGWRLLAEGTRAVRAGLPWIATNRDLTVPTPYGPAPGNGTLVAAIATAAEVEPEVAGKPQPPLFVEAARRYGSTKPLVVGDRLDTDLEGARAAGMDGLLVLTGVTTATVALAAEPPRRPHLISRDLTGLLDPHPPVTSGDDGAWHCRDAAVAVDSAGHVALHAAGEDAVDLLRAACAAVWDHADRTQAAANGHRRPASTPPASSPSSTAWRATPPGFGSVKHTHAHGRGGAPWTATRTPASRPPWTSSGSSKTCRRR
jgi:ribonucleotide monophosphatase NagD (HAD superfamily)